METLIVVLWVMFEWGWEPIVSFTDFDMCVGIMERLRDPAICLPPGSAEPWQYVAPDTAPSWPWQPRLEEVI